MWWANARTYPALWKASILNEDYYYYRRHPSAADLMPAIGVGIAAGLAGFYLVQLLIQRTPLVPPDALARKPEPPEPKSGPAGAWDRSPSG
jgi:H+/Cl- antiporter ClcA